MSSRLLPRFTARMYAVAALFSCVAGAARAQGGASTTGTATDSLTPASAGVFTLEQAMRGRDIYATNCVSCHTPADHTGGGFWAGLVGKPLSSFFKFVRENMPEDNPGAISDDDYASVVAYILQLNGLPPGSGALVPDASRLSKIRITQPDPTRKER